MSSKKSSARLFWVSEAKGCRGSSSYGFWEKFNLGVVNSSETLENEKKGTWNCSCATIIKCYQ